jgi:hypothetical protein
LRRKNTEPQKEIITDEKWFASGEAIFHRSQKEHDGIMKKIRMDTVFSHSSDVVSREIDGALIIVPLTAGVGDMEDDLFSMNETGTEIWNMLDGTKTVREVVSVLARQYRAEAGEIEQDVAGIVAELLKRRMLVEATAV